MIEKERLKELIEQEGSDWYIKNNKVKQGWFVKNGSYFGFRDENHIFLNAKEYYETQEEAEWYKEFGCIERTERLELPTWEEIQKYERFDFKDKYNHIYTLHYISGFKTLAISGWSTEYYAPATKENYTLACRKAKELFLGEKK